MAVARGLLPRRRSRASSRSCAGCRCRRRPPTSRCRSTADGCSPRRRRSGSSRGGSLRAADRPGGHRDRRRRDDRGAASGAGRMRHPRADMSGVAHVGMTVTELDRRGALVRDVLGLEPLGQRPVFGRATATRTCRGRRLRPRLRLLQPGAPCRRQRRRAGAVRVRRAAREGPQRDLPCLPGRRRTCRGRPTNRAQAVGDLACLAALPGRALSDLYCEDPFGNVRAVLAQPRANLCEPLARSRWPVAARPCSPGSHRHWPEITADDRAALDRVLDSGELWGPNAPEAERAPARVGRLRAARGFCAAVPTAGRPPSTARWWRPASGRATR